VISFNNFQTHAAIMVGTFPETSLVVNSVQRPITMATPIPLPMLIVYQLVFGILPATKRFFERSLIMEILIEIKKNHDSLSLNPPVEIIILGASENILYIFGNATFLTATM
jgi:hypothetical protein